MFEKTIPSHCMLHSAFGGVLIPFEVLQTLKKSKKDKTSKNVFYSYLECHVIIFFILGRSSLFSQACKGTEHPKDGEAALSSQHSTNSLTLQQEEKALYCSLYSHPLGKGLWISLECISHLDIFFLHCSMFFEKSVSIE